MGKAPCCSKVGLHKGPWSAKEDMLLTKYIQEHGEGQWRSMPKKAGLLRCGKSCRLRWMNYLRPGIKRGNISSDEEDLIIRLHSLLGNRWSLIAGRLPGRTDNEIKNYWNTHLIKKLKTSGLEPEPPNKSVSKRPKKESKKKGRASLEANGGGGIKKKKQQKNADSSAVNGGSHADLEEAAEKIKVYVPKPIRVSPGSSSNNTVASALSSSSSHEEVFYNNNNNNNNNDKKKAEFDHERMAGISDFDWPLLELGDANYGDIQVCEDDKVLIEGCDFSFQESMPLIENMLEHVYDEYLRLL